MKQMNNFNIIGKHALTFMCCDSDGDDTHPEDNQYNGGSNPHGW